MSKTRSWERVDELETVTVRCAHDDCPATTEVAAGHADNLRGRWRCRDHYRGVTLRSPA